MRLTRRGRALVGLLAVIGLGAYLGMMTLAMALYLAPAFH